MAKFGVLIADDQGMVRAGLRALLAGSDLEVVAEAADGCDAVRLALARNPDVVLLDVRMPGCDGLEALGQILAARPKLAVVMISAFDNPREIARSFELGARGYLRKECPGEELLDALRRAARGESLWTARDRRACRTAAAPSQDGECLDGSFTKREGEVLRHLGEGFTNEQICQALHISGETLKEHLRKVFRKPTGRRPPCGWPAGKRPNRTRRRRTSRASASAHAREPARTPQARKTPAPMATEPPRPVTAVGAAPWAAGSPPL